MPTADTILAQKGRDVITIVPDDSIHAAAKLMNQHGIGGLVVTDDDGQMIGIITERDVLRRVVAERRDPATTAVREVMSTPVVSCRAGAKLEECGAVMTAKRIRHLPVADDDGLVGIITSGDILAYQVEDQEATIQHLNSYIFNVR